MKYFVYPLFLFVTQSLQAQKSLPDSTMQQFCRLTCECATLMKIDDGEAENGIKNLRTCISTTVGVFESNDWFKKEWLNDSAWVANFNKQLLTSLGIDCPVFKSLLEKLEPKEPEQLSTVNENYFLADVSMTGKGMELNTNATTENMRRWSAKDMHNAKIQMVFDIRFAFGNEKDATDYLKLKWNELSEGGDSTNYSLKSYGADESKVFGANPGLAGIFGDIDMAQYNFVFRVKNVVAKVFVSASKKATYEEALVFAKEAIMRINTVH